MKTAVNKPKWLWDTLFSGAVERIPGGIAGGFAFVATSKLVSLKVKGNTMAHVALNSGLSGAAAFLAHKTYGDVMKEGVVGLLPKKATFRSSFDLAFKSAFLAGIEDNFSQVLSTKLRMLI